MPHHPSHPLARFVSAASAGVLACILLAAPATAADVKVKMKGAVKLPEYTPPPAYSEDLVVSSKGESFTMKRFVDKTMTRTEIMAGKDQIVMIETGDEKGTHYMLMPKEKQAMKQSRQALEGLEDEAEEAPVSKEEVTIEDLGVETLNGVAARKLKITSKDGAVLGWFEKDSGAPLRMESAMDGEPGVIEWKNRKAGPQPAELFKVPKGYEVVDMDEMMAEMKAMGGMKGMAGGMMKGAMGGMMGGMGESMGGALGAQLGGSLGGPLGAMAGQYIGGKVGGMVGKKAAGQ